MKQSFERMKRNACRLRLLPHSPPLPKLRSIRQQTMPVPSESANRRRLPPKFDARTLRALCFRKGQLSKDKLEMLCDARAKWDEFDRTFPLAEEFVKIVRGQGSMSIGLWIVKAFDSGIKELRSFANGLQKDFSAVKEATISPWSNGTGQSSETTQAANVWQSEVRFAQSQSPESGVKPKFRDFRWKSKLLRRKK